MPACAYLVAFEPVGKLYFLLIVFKKGSFLLVTYIYPTNVTPCLLHVGLTNYLNKYLILISPLTTLSKTFFNRYNIINRLLCLEE